MSARRASEPAVPAGEGADDEPTLWMELAVDLDPSLGCPLGRVADPSASGTIQLVGDTCHLALAAEGAGGVRTFTTAIDESCVCPSLCRPGCVPKVLAVEAGSLTVGAYAADRDTLQAVVEAVRSRAAAVRLERLTTATGSDDRDGGWRRAALDRVRLTDKQREAVTVAVEMGYYETPRTTTLGDMADRIGVSRSALSQRLNQVETKLVTALVEGR